MVVHEVTEALSHDIELVRQLLAVASRPSRLPSWAPGYHRQPYLCKFCQKAFTARAIRRHIPHCEANPSAREKVAPKLRKGSIRLTPQVLRDILAQHAMLDDGPSGAD